jgi:ribonuclease VapC
MTEAVLDASALIAFLREEPGAERVRRVLPQARICAVNLSEVLAKMAGNGKSVEDVSRCIDQLRIAVVPFDGSLARITASLLPPTKHLGLSLADRCCLALGLKTGLPVLTTDGDWTKPDLGVNVELIRGRKQ